MTQKPADTTSAARSALPQDARRAEPKFSGFHDSSRELAGGLEVTEGTVSALSHELRQALLSLRDRAKRQRD